MIDQIKLDNLKRILAKQGAGSCGVVFGADGWGEEEGAIDLDLLRDLVALAESQEDRPTSVEDASGRLEAAYKAGFEAGHLEAEEQCSVSFHRFRGAADRAWEEDRVNFKT